MTSEERARQIGLNEALFRQVNERIEELNQGFGADLPAMQVVCECGDARCTEQLDVDIALYERVRRDPTLFLVREGHELPEVEDVVESHEGFDVVRKHDGTPASVAEATDPRS